MKHHAGLAWLGLGLAWLGWVDPATWDDEETEDDPDTSAAPCKPLSFDIVVHSVNSYSSG